MRPAQALRRRGRAATHRLREEGGTAIVIIAMASTTLVGMSALVIDLGIYREETRQLQNAVDAAALGAARSLSRVDVDSVTMAEQLLNKNGVNTLDPLVKFGITPNYGGDSNRFEVTATRERESLFASVFNVDSFFPHARAVAERIYIPGAGSYALIALDGDDCHAFEKSGSADVNIIGGGIMVNSECPSAATFLFGGGEINTTLFNVRGGVDAGGSMVLNPPPSVTKHPSADPLEDLSDLDISRFPISLDSGGGPKNPRSATINGTATVRPGVYYGGIQFTGASTITMESGIYIMAGGGFTTAAGGRLVTTGPVLIYNTDDPFTSAPGGDCVGMNLTGGMDLDMQRWDGGGYQLVDPDEWVPSSPAWEDLSFWQASTCDQPFWHTGGHTSVTGVIYIPSGDINIIGGGTIGPTQMIAKQITLSGTSDLNILFTPFIGDETVERWQLIE